jgi:hypothetical protein
VDIPQLHSNTRVFGVIRRRINRIAGNVIQGNTGRTPATFRPTPVAHAAAQSANIFTEPKAYCPFSV